MKPLTDRQKATLDYIVDSIRRYLCPPTIREIGGAMKIDWTNGVSNHLRALARKGYIEIDEFTSRGIILTEKARDAYGLNFGENEGAEQ